MNFTFIALNSWELRVQLPREARDKGVVLPPHIQHPKIFDLKTEYTKWQNHHPETAHYSSSSLSGICTALEATTTNSNGGNNGFQYKSFSPIPRQRRALDDVLLATKILIALVKKSQPFENYPDVLTKPLDSQADISAFLAEQSKVLFLSNLPHDTTQSELESWFTQYGGRPIAFWTFRTPDQTYPIESGFAVFSTHEEAAKSLSLNGRALNERAVAVSPSGNTVLERAKNILTSFPSSKNRPRPGDWTCPSCGFSNFQRRTACFRCSYQPMNGVQKPEHNQSNGQSFMYNNIPNYGIQSPYENHHQNTNNGYHNHNSNNNNPRHGKQNGSSSVPFRAGDWKCSKEGCNYHNFAKNLTCLKCGAPRSTAAVVAEPNYHGNQNYRNHYQQLKNSGVINSAPHGGIRKFSAPPTSTPSGGGGYRRASFQQQPQQAYPFYSQPQQQQPESNYVAHPPPQEQSSGYPTSMYNNNINYLSLISDQK